MLQPERGFHLHEHADLGIGLLRIVGDMAPARSSGTGHAAHTALAVGLRIARRLHHGAGLRCAFHHGYQNGLHPQVQVLLDQYRVAHRQARQNLITRHPGNRLGLGQDGG